MPGQKVGGPRRREEAWAVGGGGWGRAGWVELDGSRGGEGAGQSAGLTPAPPGPQATPVRRRRR